MEHAPIRLETTAAAATKSISTLFEQKRRNKERMRTSIKCSQHARDNTHDNSFCTASFDPPAADGMEKTVRSTVLVRTQTEKKERTSRASKEKGRDQKERGKKGKERKKRNRK